MRCNLRQQMLYIEYVPVVCHGCWVLSKTQKSRDAIIKQLTRWFQGGVDCLLCFDNIPTTSRARIRVYTRRSKRECLSTNLES
jgi:hypothetical protein